MVRSDRRPASSRSSCSRCFARTVRIVPQARARVVERLGRYHRTLTPGLALVVPFIDRLRPLIDLREQVVSFPPQPVITEDNLVVNIDSVIYFQVTDAKAASYEIANYIQAIEQLTVTTLRNVIGGMALEKTLTSRDEINTQLRGVLDEATGKWGIRVNRVELKAIDPPASIKDSMEKQMRADREKRAAILQAEGQKQAAILTAEGEKQAAVLRAEGQREATILEAEGQAKAIDTVFKAIHEGNPDPQLLAYQYVQALPQIAQGDSNKVWIIPAEFQRALGRIGGARATRTAESSASSAPARQARSGVDARRAAAPREPDEQRRGVVAVARLAQVEVLVRAVDEPVAAGRHLRDVELLAVEERRIAVGVADRRALLDEPRLRVELLAVAEEARRPVRDADRDARSGRRCRSRSCGRARRSAKSPALRSS